MPEGIVNPSDHMTLYLGEYGFLNPVRREAGKE